MCLTVAHRAHLQDMLHSNLAVRLRFRRPRCGTPEAPLDWRACDGVGHSRGRNHGEYGGGLCVHFLFRRKRISFLFFLDAYANDCFPKHQGEISALLNLARTLGGFSVAYFQIPWATKHGALQTFGCEAAYVIFPTSSIQVT